MGCKCETLWCRWHADSLFTFFDHSTQGSQIQAPVHEWLCICNLLLVWCGRDLAIVLARSSNTCNYPSVIIYLKINSKSQHRPFRRVNIMDVVSWHTVAFSYLQCCFLVPVCARVSKSSTSVVWLYSAFLLLLSWAPQLSRDVWPDAGIQFDTAAGHFCDSEGLTMWNTTGVLLHYLLFLFLW